MTLRSFHMKITLVLSQSDARITNFIVFVIKLFWHKYYLLQNIKSSKKLIVSYRKMGKQWWTFGNNVPNSFLHKKKNCEKCHHRKIYESEGKINNLKAFFLVPFFVSEWPSAFFFLAEFTYNADYTIHKSPETQISRVRTVFFLCVQGKRWFFKTIADILTANLYIQ